MIEKMKKIVIVATEGRKEAMISGIRDLGVVHISETAAPNSALSERLTSLNRVRSVLVEKAKEEKKNSKKAPKKEAPHKILSGHDFERLHEKLHAAIAERDILADEITRMGVQKDHIAKWGDFDPDQIRAFAEKGIKFSFYLLGKKEMADLPEECSYITLKSIDKQNAIAVVGDELPAQFNGKKFSLPEMGVGQLEVEIDKRVKKVASIDGLLIESVPQIPGYDKAILKLTDEIVFNSVSDAAGSEEGLVLISGFVPESDLDAFKKAASSNSWAYVLDDPTEEDPVPTKVRYNKVTKIMKPIFDMLGTVPGYREYDISMWFLLFLSLFFGMIIGDAAYGVIMLIVSIILNIKTKKVSNINLLLYVMSIATVIWGSLTGTWFGAEGALRIPFLRKLVIPAIANYPEQFGVDSNAAQNTVMKFCFCLGMIQLSLACVMNIIRKWKQKSLALVADLAWLAIIISIYFLSLMLVIGEQVNLTLILIVVLSGLVLVIMFGAQEPGLSFGKGLKKGLAGAFTTFLDTISAFGNVMSYIRLFAVGMASLAIAQSFNGMASPMLKGWALPAGILVLVIGHGLNIIMGLLSVVVHGVRLNLLEFSGQLGMEWAGIPYEPFKKSI